MAGPGKAVALRDDMDMTEQSQTGELETAAAEAREEAEIKAAIVLARKFPRNEGAIYTKLLKSCGRASFAEEAMYSFPRGQTTVEGPSINLAREAGRLWGNLRYGLEIIREDEESRAIRGWVWDVETNTKISHTDEFKKLIQRRRDGATVWVTPDERDLRELTNRRGAVAVRNCLLQIIPKDFIEAAMDEAKKTLRKAASQDKPAKVAAMAGEFDLLGINKAALEKYLGHPLAEITDDEFLKLRGAYAAIKDDYARKEEFFGNGGGPKTAEGTLDMDALKAGTEAEHRPHEQANSPAEFMAQLLAELNEYSTITGLENATARFLGMDLTVAQKAEIQAAADKRIKEIKEKRSK